MSKELHGSIQRVIKDDKPTVRKSIIIGVGGSGMKGILSAKKNIELNMPNEAYKYMRWVGIDTTDIETSIEGKGGLYRFPSNQFFQEEKRMLYIGAPTPADLSLEFLREKYKTDESFNWLPNPDVYDISTRAGQGANQTRALGRLAFFSNEQRIREALLAERNRLKALSDDPRYFQLMDVKEGEKKIQERISFDITQGFNRYYFNDKIPADNFIIDLKPDDKTRAILTPNLTGKLEITHFRKDDKGYYFDIPGDKMAGQKLNFDVVHVPRGGQISIFITCSIVGGTGNGMIIDLVAMVKDIFADFFPKPRIYGILVLPSAFKRVVSNRNARANAYAALKEIDYYMSGNTFRAKYPSGRVVEVPDRLFDDGMLYLLDVENLSGNALQGRDQVQELTGQFVSTFVASVVGGAVEERMVNDSTRAAVYLPRNERGKRKAAYNSFGISRVIYPVPKLTELGYKITGLSMTKAFLKPVDNRLLLETLGDLNRGLVRALRLNCRLIFERMYPDYKMDTEVEFKSWRDKLKRALEKGDPRSVSMLLETMLRDYGKEEQEKIKNNLLTKMEKRYQLELGKMKSILLTEVHNTIKDANKGFLFAESMVGQILEKIEVYQKKYYKEKVALARYSQPEMEKIVEEIESAGLKSPDQAFAVIEMAQFNFAQLVFESMLSAAENFAREFKAMLFQIKNDEITILKDKVVSLQTVLEEDIHQLKFVLLEQKNPMFFYLINDKEIDQFLQRYFYARLSVEDLCNEVDFVKMDTEDDKQKIIETYLIMTEGLAILEKKSDEIKELIEKKFGNIMEKSTEEIMKELYATKEGDEGYTLSEATLLKIDIENLERKLFDIIHSRFKGFNFESISIKEVMAEKKIPLKKLLEKLDTYSRPYLYADATGLASVEYYRTITNFKLNTYEGSDDADSSSDNDLPPRLDHYKKRDSAVPQISVETFEVPNFCKPYEMISVGILLGIPSYKLTLLQDSATDYHALVNEKSHPLHCFNNPVNDARYYPDPFRKMNYINPAKLWEGLVALKSLIETNGVFAFEPKLHDTLKDMEAREEYKEVITGIESKINQAGGVKKAPGELLAEAISMSAILVKNPQSGLLQFRREYSLIVRDILDGDGTDKKADDLKMSKDEYIEKHIKNPTFNDIGELSAFLESEYKVREFFQEDIEKILKRTRENTSAGAEISLPKWKKDQAKLPEFKDKFEFFDYFEKKGSLEWQNYLKDAIVDKLNQVVTSSRFRLESDPSLLDRNKIGAYLTTLESKIPDVALWEVKVENKLIK